MTTDTIEALEAYIDSDELSDEQRDVCRQVGTSFVVRACAGSGKTRTVGTRFAWRIASWDDRRAGVAAVSFTNIAWQEIARQLGVRGLPQRPPWPHFLGTIDSFVNQHVFLPFGHVVMGCSGRPEVVNEHSRDYLAHGGILQYPGLGNCRKTCDALRFYYDANGHCRWDNARRPGDKYAKPQPSQCEHLRCKDVKKVMVRRGYALPADAMYFALRLLKRYAHLTRAIATRFPEIIVDEAQDSSETQYRIFEELEKAGADVVLVGDPEQAIYEFHDAVPARLTSLADRWGELRLSANFRSSQRICDAAHLFAEQAQKPARAKGKLKNDTLEPLIMTYEPGMQRELMPRFRAILQRHGISYDNGQTVVLVRRHDHVRLLTSQDDCSSRPQEWPERVNHLVKRLARAVVLYERSEPGKAHEGLMAALLKICFGRASYGPANEVIAEIGYRQWRIASWRLLKMLPGPSVHLTKWGGQAKEAVGRFLDEMGWKPEIELGRNLRKCSDEAADRPVADFVDLVPPEGDISCSVVHQVKGETYDAVMLYCHPADKKHRSALQQWLDPQHGEGEERRIAYVAATRPRRLLVLALPTGTSPTLLSTLQGAFVLRDD